QGRELGVGQRKRVAAGEDDFFDSGVGADALQRRLPSGGRSGLLGIGEVAAEAVAAVDRAAAGGDQQRPPVVLADHAVAGGGGTVTDRVQAEASGGLHFGIDRQHL